jgi:hypothetical protein
MDRKTPVQRLRAWRRRCCSIWLEDRAGRASHYWQAVGTPASLQARF